MALPAFLTGCVFSGLGIFSLRRAVYSSAHENERLIAEIVNGGELQTSEVLYQPERNFVSTELALMWNHAVDSVFVGILDAPTNVEKLVNSLKARVSRNGNSD